MFHLMAYDTSVAAGTNFGINSITDTVFTARNNHHIFSDPWALGLAYYQGVSAQRARINMPKINYLNRHHFFGINRSATIPNPCNLIDYRKEPVNLSQNEEMQIEVTNNQAMGNEQAVVLLWLVDPNWSMDFPAHLQRITARFTSAPVGIANDWSVDTVITFPDQDLKGGVYAVVGCQTFIAGILAVRWLFPRQPMTQDKQLRPGGLNLELQQNILQPVFSGGMGEWGRFHTFELPRIQILANAAGGVALEGRVDLLYLGEDESLLNIGA
jgi:hypothetical protein